MGSSKVCITCGPAIGPKPIAEFYVKENRARSTRYFSRCKPCWSTWTHRAGSRKKAIKKLSSLELDLRRRARIAVNMAVWRKKLKKPEKCEGCAEKFEARELHGHHHNGYEKALDVKWLCGECHREAHAV